MCSVILSNLSERASSVLRLHLYSIICILSVIDDAMCRAMSFSRHLAITGNRAIGPKSLVSVACLVSATWMVSAVQGWNSKINSH